MKSDEAKIYLPQLAGKTIRRICYCERKPGYMYPHHLFFEFDDGSHYEIYADAPLRFTGVIPYNDELGSIVRRKFAMTQRHSSIIVMVDEEGVTLSEEF